MKHFISLLIEHIKPQMTRLRPFFILGGAVLLIIIMFITRPSQAPKVIEEPAWPVSVQVIEKKAHVPQLILYGKLESPNTSEITSSVTAYVKSTPALEGHHVKQGELLVELDPEDSALLVAQHEADVANVQAQLIAEQNQHQTDLGGLKREEALFALAQKALDREIKLNERNLNSKAQLDSAKQALEQQGISLAAKKLTVKNHESRMAQLEASLKRNEALLAQAQLDLKRTQIRAPFDGRVTSLHVSPGERIQPGSPVVEVFNTHITEVRAQIPSTYVQVVRDALNQHQGLKASLYLDNQELHLILDRLAGSTAQGRGGVDGLFKLQEQSLPLVLGRAGKITLDLLPIENSVLVPSKALYDNNRIYILDKDSRMKAVNVALVGERFNSDENSYYLVKSDALKAGEAIVTTPLSNAVTGLKVNVVEGRPN